MPLYLIFNNEENLIIKALETTLYDAVRPLNSKKTLMPRLQSPSIGQSNQDDAGAIQNIGMVETVLFDIYLCDNCEAELYSKEAYEDHEKHCILDDDVICCELLEQPKIPETILQQSMFLSNFGLRTDQVELPSPATLNKTPTKHPKDPPGKLRRMPKRGRAMMAMGKCPTIPFSSPAGQTLLKMVNSFVNIDYARERLDRIERFCPAPCLVGSAQTRPKFMDRKTNNTHISSNFRKPPGYSYRGYTFPRRQFSRKRRDEAFMHLNYHFLRKCTVHLKKMTPANIEMIAKQQKEQAAIQRKYKPARRKSQQPIAAAADVIDLCSSEDEQSPTQRQSDRKSASSSSQSCSFERINVDSFCNNSVSSLSHTATLLNDSDISIHPIFPSRMPTMPGTSTQSFSYHSRSQSPTSVQSSSVYLISHSTKTSMTLANHKKAYKYRNQENSHRSMSCINVSPASVGSPCSSIELALPNSVTLTAASHYNNNNDNNKCLPEVVIERILHPNQQMCIDLT